MTLDKKIKDLINNRQFDIALNEIEKRLAKNPEPELYILKGNILAREEKSSEAIKAFDSALKIDPRKIMAYNGRALVYLCLGQAKKGAEEMEKGMIMANIIEKQPGISIDEARKKFEKLTNKTDLSKTDIFKPEVSASAVAPISAPASAAPAPAQAPPQAPASAPVRAFPKFCTKCGSKIDAGAKFCTKCGNKIA